MQGVFKVAVSIAVMAVLLCSTSVSAQAPVAPNESIEAKGIGISGGIIAGAEIVLLTEAIIDVKSTWAWWVFPVLGAGGGGVGGYYLEKASPVGAIALFVSSMALLIPTVIATSVSRSYDPADDGAKKDDTSTFGDFSFELDPDNIKEDGEVITEVESRPENIQNQDNSDPSNENNENITPPTEPKPSQTQNIEGPASRSMQDIEHQKKMATHLASGALFHIDRDWNAGIGVPAVDIRSFTQTQEMAINGQKAGFEIHIPVLRIDLP